MVFRSMIAAAALAAVAVPSMAVAGGDYSKRVHLLQDLKAAKADKLKQLKLEWKSGNSKLTRAEYEAKLARLQAVIDRVQARIEVLKEKKASA